MAYQAEDRDLLEEKVKAVYLQLRLVGDASPAQQRHAQEELRKVLSNIKAIGEPRLIKQQRRGAIWEHNAVYPQLHKLVPGITKDDISPAHDSNQASAKRSLELWREAECLALRPHSMARLKALPELRQIIAHAAVPAIHSCAGELRQLAAAAQTQRDAEADAEALWEVEKARRQPGGEAQLSRAVLQRAAAAEARLAKAAEAAAAGAAAAGDEDELFSADVRQMLRKEWLDDDSDKELLAHVAPGLRLCLAAEVAVGMLCVGQPPPPDTPEHAAALQMFVVEAWKHVDAELDGDHTKLAALMQNIGQAAPERNTAAGIRRLSSHMDASADLDSDLDSDLNSDLDLDSDEDDIRSGGAQQQQQQRRRRRQRCVKPPRLSRIGGWGLAPHLDLQLQLPPQQLLQLLLELVVHTQQQQQQQQQQQPMGSSSRLALNRAKDVAQQHPHGTLEARDCPADISSDPEVPVVITMLRNASDVRDCYLGANGLFKVPGGPSASLFVDCTTVDTATTRKLAAAAGMLQLSPKAPKMPGMALADGKPHLIDAPVTGAVTGAEAGTLTFMVGGNKAAAEAAAPILRTMGSHIIHCGDHGAGISAKLCNNLVLAASMAALAEALALGKRMGLDPAVLTDVLNRGAARCWSKETYNPVPGVLEDPLLPSNRGYKAGLPLSNVSEHLNMLLEAAKVAKSPTPVARSVQLLYERDEQEGLGDKDFSSVFRYVYGSGCDNTEWKDGQQLFSSHVP